MGSCRPKERKNDMRANLPSIAALAAGGLLLMQQSRKRRHAHPLRFMQDAGGRDLRMPAGAAVAAVAALAAGGLLLSRQLRNGSAHASTIEESVEIDVPVSTAYNQWTQFEEFPRFMANVESVRQVDDTHLHWRARFGGKVKEWDSEITEQIPDQRIAWRTIGGVHNAGVVTFHRISDTRTRVMLQMDYTPGSPMEKLADVGGAVKLTTRGNLKRFKELLENRGQETGAWRGTVQHH